MSNHQVHSLCQSVVNTLEPSQFSVMFPIRMQDTDNQLRVKPIGLLGIMQESAILDSEAAGRGLHWFYQRNLGWIVAQIRSIIYKRPMWQQQIRAITWFSEIGSMLCRREFFLVDEANQPLLSASTLWSCIDTSARKAVRLPADLVSAHSVYATRALDVPFRRPVRLQQNHDSWDSEFAVRHRHIDFNGHVNNLCYLEWILETLPHDFEDDYQLSEINIRFQKEIGPGDKVRTLAAEIGQSDKPAKHIAHEIILDPAGQNIASAETIWTRKTKPDFHHRGTILAKHKICEKV